MFNRQFYLDFYAMAACSSHIPGDAARVLVDTIVCPICDRPFTGKNRDWIFKRHYKAIHLKLERYSCEICGMKFNYYNQRKRHIKKCVYR